ncbi:unnamed protein product [Effrenium voratum]|nr:unnamed protein product [Effrenium voratum]
MFGAKPIDPSDLSPPDELAQALSLWSRHSGGAASRGAQAAAYARSQAAIAHNMAYQAAMKIRDLDDNECVQKYAAEFESPQQQSLPAFLSALVPPGHVPAARRVNPCSVRGPHGMKAFL